MKDHKYGEFEMVSGTQLNAANKKIAELELKLTNCLGYTDKQAEIQLMRFDETEDSESSHYYADQLLCDLLANIYPRTVKFYKTMPKWYA